VVERHHLHPDGERFFVSDGGDGLVQPMRVVVAVVEQPGGEFLRGGVGVGAGKSRPEIFNTDQGVQYTSQEFTRVLERRGVRISMDGKGRALDNVFVERLWRSVKQEEVYLKSYADGWEAEAELGNISGSTTGIAVISR
jgi:transposase InsO family protein